ncbi:hypothetical protein [Vandammella animalimorsus]|uniref:Uncharacterized protein n=1 Tax=Vandammella animalimorsus TaxID=2029117 RepID=A0A2A2ADW9_9BURK|nr:hypothetical protein [Vandammella animalimorsus]PAT35931.1 hypothetical protein CK620_01390 [Vandammella animalimorsus]
MPRPARSAPQRHTQAGLRLICQGLLALGLMAAAPLAQALTAPAGWAMQTQQNMTAFVPPGLSQQEQGRFVMLLSAPLPMNGLPLQEWARQMADRLSDSYGKLLSRGSPGFQAPLWRVQHRLQVQGQALSAFYHAFVHAPDQARIAVMLGQDALLQRYAEGGAQIIASALREAPAIRAAAQASAAANERGNDHSPAGRQRPAPSPQPQAGQHRQAASALLPFAPCDIHAVLNHSETSYEVYGLEVIETTHVLLKNGRLYTNGQAQGQWRKAGSGYQQRGQGSGWQALLGDTVHGLTAQALVGSFNADRGASFGTTSAVTRNRLRLLANGRFEAERGFSGHTQMGDAITTPRASTSRSHSREGQGTWRLLGPHVLELRDDDGRTQQLIGYFTDAQRRWLNLDQTAYQRSQ